MIGSSGTGFRIRAPQTIADATTEASANNAVASGYQRGYARPATQSQAGFSVNAKNRMRAAQNEAAEIAGGAREAAGIRAEDQAFNSQQQWDNDLLKQQAMLFDFGQSTDKNSILADARFARMQGLSGIAMARQRAAMQLRLALLSKGLM